MKQEDGQWTLQSVSTQKSYVGFKNTPKDGTPLFGINTSQSWDIEILEESEDHDNLRVRYVLSHILLAMVASEFKSL